MFSSLFLEKEKIPTIEIDPKQHIYRCRQSKSELVKAPLFPRLRDDERTVHHVWSKASETNAHKPGFGYRKLVKVSAARAFLVIFSWQSELDPHKGEGG